MANSLEFSNTGHPIENRYDGYGEFLADSLPEDPEQDTDRLTRKIDTKRAAFLASGQLDDYCPFSTVEGEDDEVTK